MTRKHRTVVQNRFSSFFGPLGALWSSRLTSQRSKVADGTFLGAALGLKVARGDAAEPPWPSKVLPESAPEPSMVPKVLQKLVPEPRKQIKRRPEHASQPLVLENHPWPGGFVPGLPLELCLGICYRSHICLLSSFLGLLLQNS